MALVARLGTNFNLEFFGENGKHKILGPIFHFENQPNEYAGIAF